MPDHSPEARILALFSRHKELTRGDMETLCRLSPETVDAAIRRLVTRGRIRFVDQPGGVSIFALRGPQ